MQDARHLLLRIALAVIPLSAHGSPYLDAVTTHADRFLDHGRDQIGKRHTPLFVDGLDVKTLKPAEWIYGGSVKVAGKGQFNELADRTQKPGERWVLANTAGQADFLRVLDVLTEFTGEAKYRAAGRGALGFAMKEFSARGGLFYWGGHIAYDCRSDSLVVEQVEHELRCHFVPLELMAKLDAGRTRGYVEAVWHSHINDWRSLDMNRHGDAFFRKPPRLRAWRMAYNPPEAPFKGKGRAFCHTATDLIAAASFTAWRDDNERAAEWAQRLAERYAQARHPETGLGGREFVIPSDDRASEQFAAQFGPIANDANILGPAMAVNRYARLPLTYLGVREQLGAERGKRFQTLAVEDLLAFGKHVYQAEHDRIGPMFVDGQRIVLSEIKRAGHYYDPESPRKRRLLDSRASDPLYLWAFAKAFRLSADQNLLPTLRALGRAHGLGDLTAAPNLRHSNSNPHVLMAMLELHRAYGGDRYLAMARQSGDRILGERRKNGFLLRSQKHRYSRCITPEALALLHLHAMLAGKSDALPTAWPTYPYFQCRYQGRGRLTDREAIYKQKR